MFVIELSETTVEKHCDRCGQPIKPGEGYAETDIGSGKWVHWPSCTEKIAVSSTAEKQVSPGRAIGLRSNGEAFLVDGLTMKDYYDLRDLRLLLWGIEKELVGKYGIIEADPLAGKVRELIKKKVSQVESKISPEHHSNPEKTISKEKFTVRFNEGTGKQEDVTLEAPSTEAATILAARTYYEKHGAYPLTAKLLTPNPDGVEAWRKRERIQRPPF